MQETGQAAPLPGPQTTFVQDPHLPIKKEQESKPYRQDVRRGAIWGGGVVRQKELCQGLSGLSSPRPALFTQPLLQWMSRAPPSATRGPASHRLRRHRRSRVSIPHPVGAGGQWLRSGAPGQGLRAGCTHRGQAPHRQGHESHSSALQDPRRQPEFCPPSLLPPCHLRVAIGAGPSQ